jgi:hypothetical protein
MISIALLLHVFYVEMYMYEAYVGRIQKLTHSSCVFPLVGNVRESHIVLSRVQGMQGPNCEHFGHFVLIA